MKTLGFSKIYTDKKKFDIVEHLENGETRIVSSEYIVYKNWTGKVKTVPWVAPKPGVIDKESAWLNVRAIRDALLKECDWTQLADTKIEGWGEYRQHLRDIPQVYKSPEKALKAIKDMVKPGGK